MADNIIILDDEGNTKPSSSESTSSSQQQGKHVSPLKAQQPVATHITQSPFASAKKQTHVLQAENQKLFTEFVEHCSTFTQDCPEVLTYLQTKHSKASPEFLSSVEFRNTLGRSLTRAQANRNKTFVYINELCTVLKQHATKKRQQLFKVEPGPSTSTPSSPQSTSDVLKSKDETKGKMDVAEEAMKREVDEEKPSTSGLQEDNKEEDQEAEKKTKRASRRQIAYLENLLKVYNDEICRLQQADLSLDDMAAEDSLYIQEHKLKRKMMKIYEKLCELKGCNTLTGRVIEQKILYSSTRYPEINRKIQRFINSPEAQRNPPDYQDILKVVLHTNERHNLCLSKKQLNQIALEAFRETGSRMQERRHLDLVYNFGSHLTDTYKPATDPALTDPSLLKKLRSNREVALSRLEEVITKYSVRQEDTEEQERRKRLEKDKVKEGSKSEKDTKEVNGMEEEDDEEEEDESSDPDIEDEIKASTQQDGPDDDSEEDESNEADQVRNGAKKDDQTQSVSAGVEGSVNDEEDAVTSALSPASDDTKSQISPLSDIPSPRDSPSQSEPTPADDQRLLSNGDAAGLQEPVDSSNQVSLVLVNGSTVSPAAETNGTAMPLLTKLLQHKRDSQTTNGKPPPPNLRSKRSEKRKRNAKESGTSTNTKDLIIHCSEADNMPMVLEVFSCRSPQQVESSRADTPSQEPVSSSQSTPPPKRNKVNVATQCDPDEIIVLSDSE